MMETRCPPLPAPSRDMEQARRDLRETGCCIIPDLLSPDQVSDLLARTLEQAECERAAGIASCESGAGRTAYANDGPNQRVWNLLNKGDAFAPIAEHPLILDLVRDVLGDDILLSSLTANIAGKGGSEMFLHMDQGSLPAYFSEPVVCNVAWILSGYSEEGGATRIIPNSHHLGYRRSEEMQGSATVAAAAPPGSALIFEGRIWHATGENLTDDPRVALLAFYSKPWLRQQENGVASIRDDVLAGASDTLKTLLGFRTWAALGGLDGHNTYGAPFTSRARGSIGPLERARGRKQ
ncbi:phytanoyl-CoA dioxygenase family protein [Sphingomonas colocasiae]|uniref:Phytanoyl-CoA dioxygenase family protein n=1 Tax=Sphingomonas colocasiae TaxID=1848973 RepID=A0ABS7PQU7_9SPHN|nr:phytanoyl-CoA dioxygenase family protein [Sphingomonas colocasiae]MBY8823561.1 phytanoyl-CoA dioxygenase family protein [Sphingomonas colocasiae]